MFSTVTVTKLPGIKLNKDDEDTMIEKEVSVVTNPPILAFNTFESTAID